MSSKISADKSLKTKEAAKVRKTWSQTKRVGDNTEEMTVEKLDNTGFLIVVSKSWYDSKGNWQRKESKMYSDVNPLDENESDDPIKNLADFLVGNKK